jgi:hypothetical protein
LGGWACCGVRTWVAVGGGVAGLPASVPEGAFDKAMYPNSPFPPHKSSGYPGQGSVQPVVVELGAKFEHQHPSPCTTPKAKSWTQKFAQRPLD